MRRWTIARWVLSGGLLAGGMLVAASAPTAADELAAYTARLTHELRARDAQAAELFEQANAARDGESWPTAETLYRELLQRQPEFHPAIRRLAGVVLHLERRDEALALARQAVRIGDVVENRAALARILAATPKGKFAPPAADVAEALGLARVLAGDPQADRHALAAAGHVAMAGQDVALLRQAARRLETGYPDDPEGCYLRWVLAMSEKRSGDAAKLVAAASRAGMPADVVARMDEATKEARPRILRWWDRAWPWLAGWVAAFAALLLSGLVLSAVVARSAERLAGRPMGSKSTLTSTLRALYRVVLWASCVFYYVSIPVVLASVLALAGSVFYGFYCAGRIPIRLALLVVVMVVATIWAVLKGLLARGRDEDPGERLDLAAEPRLRDLLVELAQRLGTRTVDNVYLTPGTDVAVWERGGLWRQLAGRTERCLVLGIGVLDGMSVGALRAVLAHEYGHFVNRDTAGGGFALTVRRSLLTMAESMATGGAATWFNPAWLFLNGFYRVFLRISHGASRLQEVLADRWAAWIAGAAEFEEGLRHVIAREAGFGAHVDATLQEVIAAKAPLANLYRFAPSKAPDEQALHAACEQALSAKPSGYDTHPTPLQRFDWIQSVTAVPDWPASVQRAEAWSLFSDRESLERRMTGLVRASLAATHGVSIPAAPA